MTTKGIIGFLKTFQGVLKMEMKDGRVSFFDGWCKSRISINLKKKQIEYWTTPEGETELKKQRDVSVYDIATMRFTPWRKELTLYGSDGVLAVWKV